MKMQGLIWFVIAMFVAGCAAEEAAGPTLTGAESAEEGGVEGAEEGGSESVLIVDPTDATSEEGGEEGTEQGGDGSSGEGGGDIIEDSAGPEGCTSNEECNAAGTENPCADIACVDGSCEEIPKEDGMPCGSEENQGECYEPATCQAGECVVLFVENGTPCGNEGATPSDECARFGCMDGTCAEVADESKEGQSCEGLEDQGLCKEALCQAGACTGVPLADGTACDDGTVCTAGAVCNAGDCKSDIDVACDDGSACTLNDVCVDAQCLGEPVDCSDGDDCTLDLCDDATGSCSYEDDTQTPGCPYYDGDGDGIPGKDDNCATAPNATQEDWDGDGVGDACAVNACLSASDVSILKANEEASQANPQANPAHEEAIYSCVPQCGNDDATCSMAECIAEETGLTADCAGCLSDGIFCQADLCSDFCVAGGDWQLCESCVEEKCTQYKQLCTGLGQPEQGGSCAEGTTVYCDGTCWPPGWFDTQKGNMFCNPELNCEANNFDDGDCGQGGEGGMEGGMEEGGEQGGGGCEDGSTPDCSGGCVQDEFLGNGQCDPPLNCMLTNWDGGDCEPSCPAGETMDCGGTCTGLGSIASEISNGSCSAAYDCDKFAGDGGDCGSGDCGANQVKDCSGACIPFSSVQSSFGNGSCDSGLGCVNWQKDDGDCDGACLEASDSAALEGENMSSLGEKVNNCMQPCQVDPNPGECVNTCLASEFGTSSECTFCLGGFGQCGFSKCAFKCANPNSEQCAECVASQCLPELNECTGFSIPE